MNLLILSVFFALQLLRITCAASPVEEKVVRYDLWEQNGEMVTFVQSQAPASGVAPLWAIEKPAPGTHIYVATAIDDNGLTSDFSAPLTVVIAPQTWRSASVVTFGTGTKTFLLKASRVLPAPGETLLIWRQGADNTVEYMSGTVLTVTGNTIAVDITTSTGVGTFNRWELSQ